MDSGSIARKAAELAVEELGRDVVILDLHTLSDAVDYFVIISAISDIHTQAIASGIEKGMKELGARPDHREGAPGSSWILLDFIDVVVHCFRPSTREFYALEELWGDAPMERLEQPSLAPEGYDQTGEDDAPEC